MGVGAGVVSVGGAAAVDTGHWAGALGEGAGVGEGSVEGPGVVDAPGVVGEGSGKASDPTGDGDGSNGPADVFGLPPGVGVDAVGEVGSAAAPPRGDAPGVASAPAGTADDDQTESDTRALSSRITRPLAPTRRIHQG